MNRGDKINAGKLIPMKQSSLHVSITNYILCWVEQNLNTGAAVTDLIKLTGYSRSAVEYLFMEEFGLRLGLYIFHRRMTHAAVMLRLSSLTVTEIAEAFRYYSGPNFARAFRSCFGKSPTEYRNDPTRNRIALQIPLEYRSPDFQAAVFDFDTPYFICGQRFKCTTGTGFDTENDNRLIAKLNYHAKIHDRAETNAVWIAATITSSGNTLPDRQRLVNVDTVIGDITEYETGCSMGVSPGKYAVFYFTGLREEFLFFLRQALTEPVAITNCTLSSSSSASVTVAALSNTYCAHNPIWRPARDVSRGSTSVSFRYSKLTALIVYFPVSKHRF
ncbi:helix-turn-helix transcriptional regulator [Morganella psychrotolerans]|uniref:Helix-turn-helix transcriptional regulator n=1 Tax=Morganella psychrotolerans TaxID=368603 RepID=A0A5M9R2D1_9GAMM|nr:helix-turn-helix transcriptional regulator [Morganella psychrotolerans]OBU04420.1 hypothetical protein AYY16_11535 [Morganella psychrotolerans]